MGALPLWDQFGSWAGQVWLSTREWMWTFHKSTEYGALVALGSLIFVLIVLSTQNRNTKKHIRQYRHYEIALVVRNKLSVHRLVDYHRGIAWRDFAAISTGSGIAGAALMFSNSGDISEVLSGAAIVAGDATSQVEGLTSSAIAIIIISVGVQVASAIMMMICDFIHTNTISPIVPPLQRMRIVGEAIVLGGGAMIFNIAALISFLSVFSPWVSVFCSIVFAFVVIRLTSLRGIEVDELLKWIKMSPGGEWDAIDLEVRTMNKHQRDQSVRDAYYANSADSFEDPSRE